MRPTSLHEPARAPLVAVSSPPEHPTMLATARPARVLLRSLGRGEAPATPRLTAAAGREYAVYHTHSSDATTIPLVSWVLVVEDDPDVRETLWYALHAEGYGVCEAADGFVALAALRTSARPLVTVLDYRLPGMTGGEVVAAVAADPQVAGRHTFVLVTAERENLPLSLVLWADQQGIRIVAKPFDLDALLAAVAEAAGRLCGGARVVPHALPPAGRSPTGTGGPATPHGVAPARYPMPHALAPAGRSANWAGAVPTHREQRT
jgi:CheY-like chemotaxis protein